ncbi:hypothetical protein [Streptomyces sp. NBC_00690]|uniref:hypothetical protein n=1 Tax=Streptomyces sp. NBC_00690 TaxID=2975808 RepID=UPI002E2A1A6F|nr:hypothetical protein [Streptomyces sp. NBC_00690]
MAEHYPYRIITKSGDLFVVWQPGAGDDPNELAVDEHGRLLVFEDLQSLEEQGERSRWTLISEEDDSLDLSLVREWVWQPRLRSASPGLLLDAWNFLEDLSHTLEDRSSLPAQGPVHDSAYEKFYEGDPLASDGSEEAWTEEETAAVNELLRAGLDLWEQAVSVSGTHG